MAVPTLLLTKTGPQLVDAWHPRAYQTLHMQLRRGTQPSRPGRRGIDEGLHGRGIDADRGLHLNIATRIEEMPNGPHDTRTRSKGLSPIGVGPGRVCP